MDGCAVGSGVGVVLADAAALALAAGLTVADGPPQAVRARARMVVDAAVTQTDVRTPAA